jgi:hypothetical protein
MPLSFSEQELLAVDQVFHPFPLKIGNATQHESCVPRQTGQLSYWEILKCLGEIWRMRQKFRRIFNDIRVLVGFDRVFDQSLTIRGFELIKRIIRCCQLGFRGDDPS